MTPMHTLVFLAALAPHQVDLDAILKNAHRQAQAAADAVVAENFEKVVDLTYPKVVGEMGGKAKMIESIKKMLKAMKARDLTVLSLQTEAPAKVFRAGREIMTIVPQTLELGMPDGKLKGRSFVVGISTDGGKTWTFVDGNIGEDRIREIVSNLPREMKLPQPQLPVVEKKK